jgi:hypothetical protein
MGVYLCYYNWSSKSNINHSRSNENILSENVLKEGNELGLDKMAFKRENMDSAFQTTFRDFKSGLKNARTFDPDRHVKDAFKLLCIGEKMQPLFKDSAGEKTKWAFQQFVVNLEMYSFRLEYHLEFVDHEKGEFQTITQIAQQWPIGMIEVSQIYDDVFLFFFLP